MASRSQAISAMDDGYGPVLGAEVRGASTRFALWTTRARDCAVRVTPPGGATAGTHAMAARGGGLFEVEVAGAGHGTRYQFLLDGVERRDPYARFLPDGVQGPAMVWQSRHAWKHDLPARPLRDLILYELHVGTFTRQGTYAAAAEHLPALAELGITAVELMPVAAFAGARGWGYDGVAHYAPFAPYGDPDQLRAFIDRAHGLGLAVLLDVVYNHLGPAGNVLPAYAAEYFTAGEQTPWGDAPDFGHPAMRAYVARNVDYWLDEFRFDGLRLDAVFAIIDRSPRHILTELADRAARLAPARLLIAEDERNHPAIVRACGFDAVWADDFHHQLRVALTGERDGYYAAYSGRAADLAATIEGGWFYRGATYPPSGRPRGADAGDLPAEAFVYCIQNHDQIGNRALGDRLTDVVSTEAYAAASMLLLFLPMTPLLFMGQEWAASSPFLYFTDHDPELGRLVTEGRRREFARFAAFADPALRAAIPDPQAVATFERSRLDWAERDRPAAAAVLALYRRMLELRATDPVLRSTSRRQLRASAHGDLLVVDRWHGGDLRRLCVNLGREPAAPPADQLADPRVLLASAEAVRRDQPIPPTSAILFAGRRR